MGYLSKGVGGALGGAGSGAVIGTALGGPVLGTAIGAGAGLIGGLLSASDEEETRKQNLYDKALEAQYSGWFGQPTSTSDVRQIATTEGDLQRGAAGALQGFGTVEAMKQAKENNIAQAKIMESLADMYSRQNTNVAPLGSAYSVAPATSSYGQLLGVNYNK